MKKFEYLIKNVAILFPENIQLLDDLGAEGWELVCVEVLHTGNAIFKRELEEDE